MKPDDVSERLLELAVRVGKVVDALPETSLGKQIAGQLVRSRTSRESWTSRLREADRLGRFGPGQLSRFAVWMHTSPQMVLKSE